MIDQSGLTVLDVVTALAETGFTDLADRVLGMAKARVTGDYLQTAAIFDEEMNVLSALQDPNDYRGPGTGYRPSAERQAQIDAVRQARSVADLVKEQATFAQPERLRRNRRRRGRRRPPRGRHRRLTRVRYQAVSDSFGSDHL